MNAPRNPSRLSCKEIAQKHLIVDLTETAVWQFHEDLRGLFFLLQEGCSPLAIIAITRSPTGKLGFDAIDRKEWSESSTHQRISRA